LKKKRFFGRMASSYAASADKRKPTRRASLPEVVAQVLLCDAVNVHIGLDVEWPEATRSKKPDSALKRANQSARFRKAVMRSKVECSFQ